MAGWLAGRQADRQNIGGFEIFKILYSYTTRIFTLLVSAHVINSVRSAF